MPDQFAQDDPELRPRDSFAQAIARAGGEGLEGFGIVGGDGWALGGVADAVGVFGVGGWRGAGARGRQRRLPAFGDKAIGETEVGGRAEHGPLGDTDGGLVTR